MVMSSTPPIVWLGHGLANRVLGGLVNNRVLGGLVNIGIAGDNDNDFIGMAANRLD